MQRLRKFDLGQELLYIEKCKILLTKCQSYCCKSTHFMAIYIEERRRTGLVLESIPLGGGGCIPFLLHLLH